MELSPAEIEVKLNELWWEYAPKQATQGALSAAQCKGMHEMLKIMSPEIYQRSLEQRLSGFDYQTMRDGIFFAYRLFNTGYSRGPVAASA